MSRRLTHLRKLCLLILSLIILLSACQLGATPENNIQPLQEHRESQFPHKKVVMIIIDSMMGSLVENSIEKENAPALQFLIENGQYYNDLVSPFPTMSVTIESTITTGEMADKHKVPGLAWYNKKENRIVNYGSGIHTFIKNGVSQGAYDFLYHLNNTHLSTKVNTIFEELDKHHLTSGTINTLIYRGNHAHQLTLSGIIDEVTGLPETIETKGPNILALGRIAKPDLVKNDDLSDGILSRYGLSDQYSTEVAQALITQGKQPDFLMIFLPDFDKIAHYHGPHFRFERVEEYVQGILNSYGSWETALEENIFIIIGDHGQDKMVEDEGKLAINLDKLYTDYDIAPLGEPVSQGQIAFAVNQRMSYVYDVQENNILSKLAERSQLDKRIALAAWLENGWVNVISPDSATSFRYKEDGPWKDRYGQTWSFEGDTDILTLQLDHVKKSISYVNYPDVLNQLHSSLKSHDASKLILAAKPGHSFLAETIPIHPDGGDHGGVHKNDSLVAMIIAGTDQEPKQLRMVDLKDYILQLLTTSPEPKDT